jgi:oligopeptide transport system ATP-binding protein
MPKRGEPKLTNLLKVNDLKTSFHTEDGLIVAVDGVSLTLRKGETVALVGESGSGKSVTALSLLRLLPRPPAEIRAGRISFDGQDLLAMSEAEMRKVRGREIAMIFQEPMTSLNPVMTVGRQITESLKIHKQMPNAAALDYAVELLKMVGIPAPENRIKEYPHQLSGGMRQRVMIAMALACDPKLLIADEPTTALDVTIQAQILDLLKRLNEDLGMAMLMITHNMGVVAETADRVMVMYAGQVVEEAPLRHLFLRQLHPYTHGLLTSIPSVTSKVPVLSMIEGSVPSPMFYPKGCRFGPRCPYVRRTCQEKQPPFTEFDSDNKVRCWYPLVSGGEV